MDRYSETRPYTVLYDGNCPLCTGWVDRLASWDREGDLSFLSAGDPRVGERFPHIPPAALEESLHLVGPGGEVWEGAEAVEKLLRVLPGWGWMTWTFHLPLVRPLARRVYRVVARNRYRSTCTDHCA